MEKKKKLPWVTQPLVVPSKKNELQDVYTTKEMACIGILLCW